MIIRPFVPEDAAQTARIHREVIHDQAKNHYTEQEIAIWTKKSYAKYFRKQNTNKTKIIAEQNNEILGFGVLNLDGEIQAIYVDKKHLQKGIGTKLLKHLEEIAQRKGIKMLTLKSTTYALKFYKKNGYKIVRKTTYNIGDEKLPVYLMKKHFT